MYSWYFILINVCAFFYKKMLRVISYIFILVKLVSRNFSTSYTVVEEAKNNKNKLTIYTYVMNSISKLKHALKWSPDKEGTIIILGKSNCLGYYKINLKFFKILFFNLLYNFEWTLMVFSVNGNQNNNNKNKIILFYSETFKKKKN